MENTGPLVRRAAADRGTLSDQPPATLTHAMLLAAMDAMWNETRQPRGVGAARLLMDVGDEEQQGPLDRGDQGNGGAD
jgi:hypothetical protein